MTTRTDNSTEPHVVCARYHAAVELIGTRWTGAVIRVVQTGAHRFSDIRAAIPGISDTMVADRLRRLTDAGVLERVVGSQMPVSVEYHLTQKGRDLEPVVEALRTWSHRWIETP